MANSSDLWAIALAKISPEDRQYIDFASQDKLDVLTDLQALTSDAKDRSIKDRWRFRRPGHGGEGETVILRDLFSKIVTWIDHFKRIGDIIVQYDPGHAALPWAGVRFLLQIATSDIEKFDFVVEGAEMIAKIISRFAIFEQLYLFHSKLVSQSQKALEEALVRLYAVIIRYLAKAKRYLLHVSIVIEDAIKRFKAGQGSFPAYFYCSRSDAEPERSDPDTVMASILRQLSCAQPGNQQNMPLPQPLIDQYKKQGEGFKSNGLSLKQSSDLVIRLSESHSMATIIVDALDECDLDLRQSLLDTFADILKQSAGLIKIFVSSRDDQDIAYNLRGYPNLSISSDKNTADINAFVDKETKNLVQRLRLLRYSRAKVDMQTLIIDNVCRDADGMFRWASLQLELLCTLQFDGEIRATLGRIPPKLAQLYSEVFNTLVSYEGHHGRSIINNALKWLLCAKRTFEADEFLWAIAANLDISAEEITKEHLLELCRNLVIYDEGLNVFRFAHLSVREFLEEKPEFHPNHCHTVATDGCLLQIIASSQCSTQYLWQIDERLIWLRDKTNSNPESASTVFLAYANAEWMDHCRFIPESIWSEDTGLGCLVRAFLVEDRGVSSALVEWVQWYCSRVLEQDAPEASWQLQALLVTHESFLSRTFLIAIHCGLSELVAARVQDRVFSDKERSRGLNLAAMGKHHKIIDILVSDGQLELTESMLFYAVQDADTERLAWLLDKGRNVTPTKRIVTVVSEDQSGKLTACLLKEYPNLEITEQMLKDVALHASPKTFSLLLAQAPDDCATESVLYELLRWEHQEKVVLVLDRFGDHCITTNLLQAASFFHRIAILKIFLNRGGSSIISTSVIESAAGDFWSIDSLQLFFDYGGRLQITANMIRRATCCIENLQFMLDHGGKIPPGILKQQVSWVQSDVLKVLLEQGAKVDGHTLRMALKNRGKSTFWATLLDHIDKAFLTEEMPGLLVDAACSSLVRPDMMRLLIDQAQYLEIPELAFLSAACNANHGSDYMEMFLERGKFSNITVEVLTCAISNLAPDIMLRLFQIAGTPTITEVLLEAAATNAHGGSEIILFGLLEKSALKTMPEAILDNAIKNTYHGKMIIQMLENKFGRISMTEDLMVRLFCHGLDYSNNGINILTPGADYLFDPALVTEKVLISAMSPRNLGLVPPEKDARDIRHIVLENALHIPVTIDILKTAAANCDPTCFRFLWNRAGMTEVPECLILEASKNLDNAYKILEILLDQAVDIKNGEKVMLALVQHWEAPKLFQLLFERGFKIVNLLLQHLPSPDFNEDLFEAAANAGCVDVLESLSRFCGEGCPPPKWLELAQLHQAACHCDPDTLQYFLDRGIKPSADLLNRIMVIMRGDYDNYVSVFQMLLSVGELKPDDGTREGDVTPLWKSAARGSFEIVQLLVESGASLDFKDPKGYTPYMIAKKNGHPKVFKYLEQAMNAREIKIEPPAARIIPNVFKRFLWQEKRSNTFPHKLYEEWMCEPGIPKKDEVE